YALQAAARSQTIVAVRRAVHTPVPTHWLCHRSRSPELAAGWAPPLVPVLRLVELQCPPRRELSLARSPRRRSTRLRTRTRAPEQVYLVLGRQPLWRLRHPCSSARVAFVVSVRRPQADPNPRWVGVLRQLILRQVIPPGQREAE